MSAAVCQFVCFEELQFLNTLRQEINVRLDQIEKKIDGLKDILEIQFYHHNEHRWLQNVKAMYNDYVRKLARNESATKQEKNLIIQCEHGTNNPRLVLQAIREKTHTLLDAYWNKYFNVDSEMLANSFSVLTLETITAAHISAVCDRLTNDTQFEHSSK